MRLVSLAYAFMYWSKRQSLLGAALSTWLMILPLALAVVGLAQDWAPGVLLFLVALSAILRIAYYLASRSGYKRFIVDPGLSLDREFAAPHDEDRVPLQATGVFSVSSREEYVLEHPGKYWRVPLGQHVFMVELQPGRFLYQIIEPVSCHVGAAVCGRTDFLLWVRAAAGATPGGGADDLPLI